MLGVLCARPKPWILTSLSLLHRSFPHYHLNNHHSLRQLCHLPRPNTLTWPAFVSDGGWTAKKRRLDFARGEGSWNVAWDARPARWLHRLDSGWFLIGACAFVAPLVWVDGNSEVVGGCGGGGDVDEEVVENNGPDLVSHDKKESSNDYRVTGVLADGRCLFRAIAHGSCLRKGEEAPDDSRQAELADELRARVVDELIKRRKETEWFIEGDFDAYIKRIQQPCVWGGEPELLMASHVLKSPISVFMVESSTGSLVNIAKYGEEYRKDDESTINVLFHGYGHYDILESSS